jgi:hypothetical protein
MAVRIEIIQESCPGGPKVMIYDDDTLVAEITARVVQGTRDDGRIYPSVILERK